MPAPDPFLQPRCVTTSLDRFTVRTSILRAVTDVAPDMHGTVLDVGCGRMPYKSLIVNRSAAQGVRYLGLDFPGGGLYEVEPDLTWDGVSIPLADATVDCAMATEVFEHCKELPVVLREIQRVLVPGGFLFFTVPFFWPVHDAPHDEFRYTPFALERMLSDAGFSNVAIEATGGWDASLAQMLGLWARRRPFAGWKRALVSALLLPFVKLLTAMDVPVSPHKDNAMMPGLSGRAYKDKV
jgi:SAM-dependent methyltransferase